MMNELSELEEGQIANLQTIGQVNQEMQESISKGMKRNAQLKTLLQQKREERKAELEKEYERKENFIQNKLNEITAETTEMTKAKGFHEAIEEFVVTAFRAMKTAQGFFWTGISPWTSLEEEWIACQTTRGQKACLHV